MVPVVKVDIQPYAAIASCSEADAETSSIVSPTNSPSPVVSSVVSSVVSPKSEHTAWSLKTPGHLSKKYWQDLSSESADVSSLIESPRLESPKTIEQILSERHFPRPPEASAMVPNPRNSQGKGIREGRTALRLRNLVNESSDAEGAGGCLPSRCSSINAGKFPTVVPLRSPVLAASLRADTNHPVSLSACDKKKPSLEVSLGGSDACVQLHPESESVYHFVSKGFFAKLYDAPDRGFDDSFTCPFPHCDVPFQNVREIPMRDASLDRVASYPVLADGKNYLHLLAEIGDVEQVLYYATERKTKHLLIQQTKSGLFPFDLLSVSAKAEILESTKGTEVICPSIYVDREGPRDILYWENSQGISGKCHFKTDFRGEYDHFYYTLLSVISYEQKYFALYQDKQSLKITAKEISFKKRVQNQTLRLQTLTIGGVVLNPITASEHGYSLGSKDLKDGSMHIGVSLLQPGAAKIRYSHEHARYYISKERSCYMRLRPEAYKPDDFSQVYVDKIGVMAPHIKFPLEGGMKIELREPGTSKFVYLSLSTKVFSATPVFLKRLEDVAKIIF